MSAPTAASSMSQPKAPAAAAWSGSSQLLATVFLRLVFPTVLAACIVFRPSGFSFLYLLLFLYLPLVPRPTIQSFAGGTGRYLRLCLLLTFSTTIAQIVFQIILVALPPYGSFLVDCDLLERILRICGLVKLNGLNWTLILKWIGPDAAALGSSVITYVLISNLVTNDEFKSKKNNFKKLMSSIGPYITVAFLCFTSSLEPSVLSGIYYLVFLGCATYWSLNRSLRNRVIKWIFFFLAIFVLGHVLSLFIYQLNWLQVIIEPNSQIARLAGLVPLVLTDCDGDPRQTIFNPALRWNNFTSPFALLLLFQLLIYNFKIFSYSQEDKYALPNSQIPRQSSFSRRRLTRHRPTTMRWKSSTRRGGGSLSHWLLSFIRESATTPNPDETTPLMTFSSRGSIGERDRASIDTGGLSRVNSADQARSSEQGGRAPGAHGVEEATFEDVGGGGGRLSAAGEHDGSARASASENLTYTYLLISGLFTIYDLFAKSSYVATNIIMMAWSITYHSWLTFILLLWACVLWMFPNQRKAMLLSSPGLVFYAEVLLLGEYVFSLNLNDEELPKIINGFNLAEFGLVKHSEFACYPILIKSLYTLMFWITLRQFVMERIAPPIEEDEPRTEPPSVSLTVRRRTLTSELVEAAEAQRKNRKGLIDKFGSFLKEILTKFWIWVVAIMLFVIGLGGDQVVLYRIVYMALFLVFVLTFQLSYGAWRKVMYPFWLTVIIYSMLVLVLIYTYQFEDIPELITNYTGIPEQLQKDIGLERYDTGSLFVRLLTPTFFLVITVIQLHYFHKDFLTLSDLNKPRELEKSPSTESEVPRDKPPQLVDDMTFKNILLNASYYGQRLFTHLTKFYLIASEICWRFLEIHILKIVLFSAVMLTVYDKCALHFVLFLGVVNAVIVKSGLQKLLTHLCSIFISLLLLAKMIYQIDYINHSYWNQNCTFGDVVVVRNDAEWLGLRKIRAGSSLPDLLKGYIGMILVLTVQAVVQIRQAYQRNIMRHGTISQEYGILFPNIARADADKGILYCFKFLMNYGFYKFGVEITLIGMIIVIGTRLDVFSVLYSFWLVAMFYAKRHRLAHLWIPLIMFISILLPFQYISCVGLPPFLCPDYPWREMNPELKSWLFLPDFSTNPVATRMIPDFFLLLFASQQKYVFWAEKNGNVEHTGGSNEEILDLALPNPVPDFLMHAKTWLDIIKKCLFLSFYWLTLAIIFLTGTNRVNLFALGYLVGSFIFLWEGNEFYLRTKKSIIKRWNYLLAYNVFVIFTKSFLQLIGCVFLGSLQINFCWFVQLFGIACLNKFQPESSATINQRLIAGESNCHVPHDEAGLLWDGITFAFLLFQRRIFNSFYFHHIRIETEAQAMLASRGAELIEELMQKQIKQQEEQEKEVLEKIKMKMERIIATHQRGKKQESGDHFDAIRSGDYYMFTDQDEDFEMIDSCIPEDKEEEDEKDKIPGLTLSELMSSALKTDVEQAAESARLARQGSVDAAEDGESQLKRGDGDSKQSSLRSKRFRKLSGKRRSFVRRRPQGLPEGGFGERDEYQEIPGIDQPGPSTGVGVGRIPSKPPSYDLERSRDLPPAPLARSDGAQSQASDGGGGDDSGGGGGGRDQVSQADFPYSEDVPTEEGRSNLVRRLLGYLKFAWAFVESLMISCTGWLNKFSRDYRHVSRCLSEEKMLLKDKKSKEVLLKRRVQPEDIKLDIGESMEESPEGDQAYSRDDLQTVVEKPSPSRELSIDSSSLDDVSMSEVEKEHCPLVLLIVALWYVIISHSDLVCYFVVFLNQIKSASILSLPLPLMVLSWGTLSVPRPTKTFWVTIIAYTEAMVVIKYLFQFDFFSWNEGSLGKKDPFWPPKILGIEQKEKYALYDVTLLMFVFFHRYMLKSLGLWKNKSDFSSAHTSPVGGNFPDMPPSMSFTGEQQLQDDFGGTSSMLSSNNMGDGDKCLPLQIQWEKWEIQESLAAGPQVIKICVIKYLSSINQFFQQILNLEYKVKVDVYSYMFICDFFNFLVVIFGFASFGSQTGDVSSYLEENKVPVPFLVMVILQFALIVIDRALYLRKYILGKFFFQMFLVTLVHVSMFFILPKVTEKDFNTNLPPQMWYMVKCIYLLFSAYQIRSGYPTRILGNFLCKKYNYVNMFLFKGFMAVPFLFELRALMDWMWTETSMTLSDWLKLEDIFAHIFQLKCQRRVEKEYPQERGSARSRWTKYAIGGSSLALIIAIIWFPLVLFALGNTVGISNPPVDVSVELTIGAYQPLFTMSAQNASLNRFTPRNWNDLNYLFRSDRQALSILSNYEPDDSLMAKLSVNSSSSWTISPPSRLKLIEELQGPQPMAVHFSWTVTRDKTNPTIEAMARDKHEIILHPNDPNRRYLAEAINGSNSTQEIKLNGIFPKFLRISNSGKANVANLSIGLNKTLHWRYTRYEGDAVLRNFTLKLRRLGDEQWWEVEEDCKGAETKNDLPYADGCKSLNLYTFSEKAFPSTLSWLSGGGIIGLYTTLVLVASKFVRSFFAGISFLIIFDDMPNVDRVFQLCLDIYLVRESGELALEEDLFAKLIFLYRSPETLIKWTRPPKRELMEKRQKEIDDAASKHQQEAKHHPGPGGDS